MVIIMENEVQQNESGEAVVVRPVKKRNKVLRGFSIFGVLLLIVILIVLTVNALLTMFMDDYYTTFGSYRLFSIVSDSMEPTIPKGSMIVSTKPNSVDEINASSSETAKDGTVITFKTKNASGESILLTHRVVGISKDKDGKVTFTTRGDNAKGVDGVHPAWDDVVGIYTGKKCGFFGALFGFFASALGASVLIFSLFIVAIACITWYYINKTEARKALENAALKKSATALGGVNLRYDNIHEIVAVMDVLGMVSEEPKNHAESKMVAERLNAFIRASTFELPQTPETAAILDSLPAPDTPGSLAAALSAGATLRQAEDGQTLILTTMSGGKNIMLTPVNTPDGIILCQQGVRISTDIAPNIEAMGITSMPTVPEFFEGQPLEKNVEYPELPQPAKIGPDVLLSGEQAQAFSKQIPTQSAIGVAKQEQTAALPEHAKQEEQNPKQIEQAAKPAQDGQKPKRTRKPLTEEQKEAQRKKRAEKKEREQSRLAYLKYREMTIEKDLKRAARLRNLLTETEPLTPEEQLRVAEHRAQNPPKKRTRKPLTEEQKAKRRAADARRKQAREDFLNSLTPEDKELVLSERKLAKTRDKSIRKLRRIEADRELLNKIDE